jgi:hypothetical protein
MAAEVNPVTGKKIQLASGISLLLFYALLYNAQVP